MQFSLRTLFYATTWTAAIAGVAASPLRGRTVFAAGYSLACLNGLGRLVQLQTPAVQSPLFRVSWLLFAVSLVLPAMKGCNNTDCRGWEAAVNCGEIALRGLASGEPNVWAPLCWTLLTAGNLMLLFSPLILRRLQRGKGSWSVAVFALAAATMWCLAIKDARQLLVGYYVWCAAAIVLLSACRLHWPHLILMVIAPLLMWFGGE